jgi:hypothetical protein
VLEVERTEVVKISSKAKDPNEEAEFSEIIREMRSSEVNFGESKSKACSIF